MSNPIESIFGDGRCLVVAGACGNVGFGKLGQFGRLLGKHGVRVVALDLADGVNAVKDELGAELGKKFDAAAVEGILGQIDAVQGGIDDVPHPIGMVFEAIPERLDLKRGFYEAIRNKAADAYIFSATSGFTTKKLFEGIAASERCGVLHPFFPHLTNKLFELPTDGVTSDETRQTIVELFTALGLIALPVRDVPSFAADRVFCMMMTEAVRCREAGIPANVVDRCVGDLIGARPFLVHNLITGANHLTVSCIDELADESKSSFYEVPASFREMAEGDPAAQWDMGEKASPTPEQRETVRKRVLGALLMIGSRIIAEKICTPRDLNLMCENALAFRQGLPALARSIGLTETRALVEGYVADQGVTLADEVADAAVYDDAAALQNLYVTTRRDGDCLVIELGRAAINSIYVEEFGAALDELGSSDATCAVVIADGVNNAEFGRGADVVEFVPALGDEAKARELSDRWKTVFARIPAQDKPIVAALSRRSLGGSNELASLCTARIAAKGTTIGQPEPVVGVVPGLGGTTTLLRFAKPEHRTAVAELLLTGDPIDADKAHELGLVSEVVAPRELAARAVALAQELASGATPRPAFEAGAFELTMPDAPMTNGAGVALDGDYRQLLADTISGCASRSFDEAMTFETDMAGKAFILPAARIGVNALLRGKKPDFSQAAK